MIDFGKIEISRSAHDRTLKVLGRPKITLDSDTGEVVNERWVRDDLTFERKQGSYFSIQGNLPKYFLGIKGQQLTFSQTKKALWKLSQEYKFKLSEATFRNIEFHLDVDIGQPVSKILPYFKYYKTTPISQTRTSSRYKGALECQSGPCRFKLYDRNFIHQKQPGTILRLETHFNKMADVNNGVPVLAFDLMFKELLEANIKKIMRMFDCVLFLEPLDPNLLPFDERLIYNNWNDVQYLAEIMAKDSKKRIRSLDKLYNIQQKYGKGIRQSIIEKIANQADYSLNH